MIEDLRGKMARGVVWMVLLRLLDRSIGFLSTLVLARLLTPDNFGIVAMATSLIAMLELIAAFGFDMALIQRTKPTRAHYDTAWTFTVILGCILSVLLVGLSWPVAWFYGRPELLHVIWALAFGSLVQGFQNIGTVAFRKDMEFHKEFRFVASKRLVTVPITITLAYLLRNYWALVAGMVAGRVVDVWLSYRFHPHRPRFDLSATADLLHFSKWLLLVNALQFLRDRSPDFIIGRIAGPHALGVFSIASELANMPGTELVAPINRAVYPAYAQIAGDPVALQREYVSVMALICLLAIPAVTGVAATATLIVPLALGDKWLSAIPILQVLAFLGITQVMLSNAYSVCLALGRGNVFAYLNAGFVAILLALLVPMVQWDGARGAAYAYLLSASVMLPISVAVILRILDLPLKRFVSAVWRPLLASSIMFAIVERYASAQAADSIANVSGSVAIAVLFGIAVYTATIAIAWMLSGRPASAEAVVLARVQTYWRNAMALRRNRATRNPK